MKATIGFYVLAIESCYLCEIGHSYTENLNSTRFNY